MAHRNILLLSVSAGAGHVRAAEALRTCAEANLPDTTVTHLDVMDFVSAGFRKLYTDSYLSLVERLPAVWGYLYQATNEVAPDSKMQKLRRAVERLSTRPLRQEIRARRPDAILCTHFLPAEILSRMIRKDDCDCPVWVQVTDFDLHGMWVHAGMRGYFAANEEVAFRMAAHGIAAEAIHVTGIPIMPAFSSPPQRTQCAAEYGLDPARTTILLMGGGAGLGSLDKVAEQLLAIPGNFQLIVLAGRNAEALASLQQIAARHPGRLFPQGFTNRVESLMACADLVVTKPGGLSTSECLAMGLPMILNSPIPGQEERNADYLLEQGAALKACDAVTLEYRIRLLLGDPARLAKMRENAIALGRPDAASKVLQTVTTKMG